MSEKKTYDNAEKRFTELECHVSILHGWYASLTYAATSPRMNKPQREILERLAFPALRELGELADIRPEGGRDNPYNARYFEWLDSQEEE